MKELVGARIRLNPEFVLRSQAYIAQYPSVRSRLSLFREDEIYEPLLVLTECHDTLLVTPYSRRLGYYWHDGSGGVLLTDLIFVTPQYNSPIEAVREPFFIAAETKTTEFTIRSFTQEELKKHNTRPDITACVSCGSKLVNPMGIDPRFQHCPKCER